MQSLAAVSEHTHQVNLIRWFDMAFKQYKGRLFAIPNGGQRNIIVATKLKSEGVRPGVPDLMLPVPYGGYHGLFIEMKKVKGKISETQKDWAAFLNSNGYISSTCFGFDDAKSCISNYLEASKNANV